MSIVWVVGLLVVDQATKVWAQSTFPLGAVGREVVPGFLWFTYVQNTGAAFGLLRGWSLEPVAGWTIDGTFMLGILSAVVSGAIVRHLAVHGRTTSLAARTALWWILAGALGNMIDRFRLGYVIDFLHVRLGIFDVPVFNVADASVFCGAVLLAYLSLRASPSRPPGSTEPQPVPHPTEAATDREGAANDPSSQSSS